MSHEPKPSEHAMRAANLLHEWEYLALDTKAHEIAPAIDQHAIAPAVAERDRRIAELEYALRFMVDVGCEFYDMDTGETGSKAIDQAQAVLAKSERSAP